VFEYSGWEAELWGEYMGCLREVPIVQPLLISVDWFLPLYRLI